MTGWRLGYVAGPAEAIDAINRVHLYTVTCAVSFVQQAAIAALDGDQTCVDDMREAYRRRRDLLVVLLNEVPGVTVTRPSGRVLRLPQRQLVRMPSKEIALRWSNRKVSAPCTGRRSDRPDEGFLRIAYACSDDDIRDGVERMAKVLARL